MSSERRRPRENRDFKEKYDSEKKGVSREECVSGKKLSLEMNVTLKMMVSPRRVPLLIGSALDIHLSGRKWIFLGRMRPTFKKNIILPRRMGSIFD